MKAFVVIIVKKKQPTSLYYFSSFIIIMDTFGLIRSVLKIKYLVPPLTGVLYRFKEI